MQFETLLQSRDLILAEGSIYERLRRHPSIEFHPHLAHAALIYNPASAEILAQVFREYLDIGQRYDLPMIVSTPTWRANQERHYRSEFKDYKINQDNARFLSEIRASYGPNRRPIFICGLIGPRGDAYRPEEALSRKEAVSFHTYQIGALAETNVDFLYAATLPAISEAYGIAAAMAQTNLPYVLSFVIRESGTLLDGTPLHQAIEEIDTTSDRPPTGYAVNCVHPTVFVEGLIQGEIEKRTLMERLVGFAANTSARSPEELDALEELETEEPSRFAELMVAVHNQFHIPIIGGCCGTGTDHIDCLAGQLKVQGY
jgi:homocysteine S-methyltransferase